MERIKQALEKAKRDTAPPKPVWRKAAADTGSELEHLSYSQTRIVHLDAHHMASNRIVAFNKSEPASGRFDLLRTQVVRKMEQKGWRSLAIVSPTAGAGKTVVAINLAMSIAQQADRTSILVDFDLRRPSVASALGLQSEKSLNEVFNGEAELHEALVNPGIPRLVILPTSKPVANPAELLASKRMEELVMELKERYADRIVMFDLPPLLAVDDALAVLPKIDCALVVVGNGESTKSEVQETLRHLGATAVLGIVLNKAGTAKKTYY